MECLICHTSISINSFSMIFTLDEPKICQRCASQIIPRKIKNFPIRLYEDTVLMRDILRRIQKGDFVLVEVILPSFKEVCHKFKCDIKEMNFYEMNPQFVGILLEKLDFKGSGIHHIRVMERASEMSDNQFLISIL